MNSKIIRLFRNLKRANELERENQRLHDLLDKDFDERMKCIEMEFRDGQFECTLESPFFNCLTVFLCRMLDGFNAPNYLTAVGRIENRDYIITVQRKIDKTPHELRLAAEAEANLLRNQLNAFGAEQKGE